MTDLAKALQKFFSGFGIPAYTEEHVPEDAELPYVTYRLVEPLRGSSATLPVRVWFWGDALTGISTKVDEISRAIGQVAYLEAGRGYVCIEKGDPFVQLQPYDNPDIRVAYINVVVWAFIA